MKVVKKSGKPFKSGNKINTVKETIRHPQLSGEEAYTFHEDGSYVSVAMCVAVNNENENEVGVKSDI